MAYIAVEKNGNEYVYETKPLRNNSGIWIKGVAKVRLPKGTIELLLHRKMTWEEDPINLEDLCAQNFNREALEKVLKPRSKESIQKAYKRKLKRLISETYSSTL